MYVLFVVVTLFFVMICIYAWFEFKAASAANSVGSYLEHQGYRLKTVLKTCSILCFLLGLV